jgi:hypothetical protein
MRRPAHTVRRARSDLQDATGALLRAERRLARSEVAVVVALALAATPPILLGPAPGAIRASAAAATVAALALGGLGLARSERRLAALHLVADGHETLPLPRVAEVRAELLRPTRRRGMAADLRAHATRPLGCHCLHPALRRPGNPFAVAAAAPELERLATLLETSDPIRAEPLAACELLLVDGASSPLHGDAAAPLRAEAGRIACLLHAAS